MNYFEDERKAVCTCDICGATIYEGDKVFHIKEEKWCEECTMNTSHLA